MASVSFKSYYANKIVAHVIKEDNSELKPSFDAPSLEQSS